MPKKNLTPTQVLARAREANRRWRNSDAGKTWLADRSAKMKAARLKAKAKKGRAQ